MATLRHTKLVKQNTKKKEIMKNYFKITYFKEL